MRTLIPGLLLCLATPLWAQDGSAISSPSDSLAHSELARPIPRVQPGGIATVVISLPAADTGRWSFEAAAGVRLFVAPTGTVGAPAGEPLYLPLTFGVPADASAGPFEAGRVVFTWPEGRREVRDVVVEVLPRREASLWVGHETLTASAGELAELPYRVRNRGNASDTFRVRITAPAAWRVTGGELTVVLGPGEQATGTWRAEIPASVSAGEEYVLRTALAGTDVRDTRSSRLTVVSRESAVAGLTTVPGSIFVGSITGADEVTSGVALHAAGEVRPGVRVDLDLRHSDDRSPSRAFGGALSGPQARVSLRAETWSARAGDIFSFSDLATGPVSQGIGFDGRYDNGRWGGDMFLARPSSYVGDPDDGHIVRGSARYHTELGTFGVRASSVARTHALLGSYGQAGGVLTYDLRTGGHQLEAQAGILEVADDSSAVSGGAAEVRYSFQTGRTSIAARLRRVPGTTLRTASQGNETVLSGSHVLSEALSVTGSAYGTDAPRIDGAPYGRSRGAGLGLRLRLEGGLNASLSGSLRSSETVGSTLPASETRLLGVRVSAPAGPLTLEADADFGVTEGGFADRKYRNTRVGARWSSDRQWAWLGLTHSDFGLGAPQAGVDLSGSVRFRSAEIQGGLNAPLTGMERLRTTSFWSGITVPLLDHTSLSTGAEYRGYWTGSPWRFSLGLRRSFGVPLPIPRRPVVHGIIYEDLDGDGVRSADEPALSGIGVTFGGLRTTTDDEGRFRFHDAGRGTLQVDQSDLPLGVTVADGEPLPVRGRADIPIVRTANLELRLFLDRDGDEVQDPGEELAVRTLVSIVDAGSTSRDALTDESGRAKFSGLRPGSYRVRIVRPNGRGGGDAMEIDVVLHPGADERLLVAVPLRTREIRLPGGATMEPGQPPVSSGVVDSAVVTAASQVALALSSGFCWLRLVRWR